jgi:hypothetical protein
VRGERYQHASNPTDAPANSNAAQRPGRFRLATERCRANRHACVTANLQFSSSNKEPTMAKGQRRGNREAKKPKPEQAEECARGVALRRDTGERKRIATTEWR